MAEWHLIFQFKCFLAELIKWFPINIQNQIQEKIRNNFQLCILIQLNTWHATQVFFADCLKNFISKSILKVLNLSAEDTAQTLRSSKLAFYCNTCGIFKWMFCGHKFEQGLMSLSLLECCHFSSVHQIQLKKLSLCD